MAVNLPNNPANGDSVVLNGTTYVYNSTNNSWDIPVGAGLTLPLSTLSVGPEATPSGDGAISYDNTTGVFTYTPPVISGGSGTTAYANITDLPTSEVTTGAMAYVSANNKLYMWNGTAWFNIAIVNQAPTAITGNQASYFLATDGTPTVVTLVSTDPEGLPLTWSSSTSGDTQVGTLSQTDNVFTITPSTDEADTGTLSVTFSVTDGNNTETSVSSFILEFVSAYWNETVLSIGTSSTNGLANSTFIDRSTNAHTVTPAGSPVQTAFHPYLDNWSVEFDSGQYIAVSNGTDIAFGTDDFTISFWVYFKSAFSGRLFTNTANSAGESGSISFSVDTSTGAANFTIVVAGEPGITSTAAWELNKWHHVEISRTSGTGYIFLDGQILNSESVPEDFSSSTYNLNFGMNSSNSGGAFNGFLSNVHFVKGIGGNTSNFTPPTDSPTKVNETGILLFGSNRFIDQSDNLHTIVLTGAPKVSSFNPFGQEFEYAVGENKGSVLFDATSYLTAPQIPFGTADFTVEGWHFLNSRIELFPMLFSNYNSFGAGAFGLFAGHNNSTQTQYQIAWNGSFPALNAGTIKYNEWVHFAVVRNSGTVTLYINGVSVGSFSGTQTINGVASVVSVSYGGDAGTTTQLDGYISDWTISAGTAKYATNFTPPTAPVGNTNASLYLPMDNAGIFDKTGNNTLTPVGNASTSTTQTKYADTAIYFDGSGDSIYIHDTQPLGNGDWTIEFWVNASSLAAQYKILVDYRPGTSQGLYPTILLNYGVIGLYYSTGMRITGTTNLSVDTWHHVAISKSGSSTKMFLDGTQEGSTLSDANTYIGNTVYVGGNGFGAEFSLLGYIENLQILKGVAKYTANFTPPNRTQGRGYQEES